MHLLRFFWFCGFEINTLLYPSILCMCFFCLSSLCLSSLYVSAYFILTSPIFVCLFLSFLCVCVFHLCVCVSHLCVSGSFVFMFQHLCLCWRQHLFTIDFFFPSWLCVVPSFCSLVLYFGIVCVVVIFVAIFPTRSNTCFLFFSLIVVSTLSFFAFTPYLDVTCVVPFTSIVIFYLVSSTRCLQELLHGF